MKLDHVMIGYANQDPVINPEEVADWKWMDIDAVREDIEQNPQLYTAWFKIIFQKFYHFLEEQKVKN